MYNELLLFALVGSVTGWLAIKHAITVARGQRQIEILRRGRSCEGRIVGIQRPFMLDTCTRLYFDFVPEGSAQPLRACHVDHRAGDPVRRGLPPSGSIVTVRYLPDRPRQAVISGLVSAGS